MRDERGLELLARGVEVALRGEQERAAAGRVRARLEVRGQPLGAVEVAERDERLDLVADDLEVHPAAADELVGRGREPLHGGVRRAQRELEEAEYAAVGDGVDAVAHLIGEREPVERHPPRHVDVAVARLQQRERPRHRVALLLAAGLAAQLEGVAGEGARLLPASAAVFEVDEVGQDDRAGVLVAGGQRALAGVGQHAARLVEGVGDEQGEPETQRRAPAGRGTRAAAVRAPRRGAAPARRPAPRMKRVRPERGERERFVAHGLRPRDGRAPVRLAGLEVAADALDGAQPLAGDGDQLGVLAGLRDGLLAELHRDLEVGRAARTAATAPRGRVSSASSSWARCGSPAVTWCSAAASLCCAARSGSSRAACSHSTAAVSAPPRRAACLSGGCEPAGDRRVRRPGGLREVQRAGLLAGLELGQLAVQARLALGSEAAPRGLGEQRMGERDAGAADLQHARRDGGVERAGRGERAHRPSGRRAARRAGPARAPPPAAPPPAAHRPRPAAARRTGSRRSVRAAPAAPGARAGTRATRAGDGAHRAPAGRA